MYSYDDDHIISMWRGKTSTDYYYNGNIVVVIRTFIKFKWCCPWEADTFQLRCDLELVFSTSIFFTAFFPSILSYCLFISPTCFLHISLLNCHFENVIKEFIFKMSIKIVCFQYTSLNDWKCPLFLLQIAKKFPLFRFYFSSIVCWKETRPSITSSMHYYYYINYYLYTYRNNNLVDRKMIIIMFITQTIHT